MDIKGSLTRKIGPLPAVAWVGGAAFIYVIYRYMKTRSASTATNTATSTDTSGGVSQDAASPWGTGAGGGSTVLNPSATPTSTAQTNVDWGKMAENWAIAQGFNPSDVATALGSYLYQTGQSLNSTQSSILTSALKQFGAPPEGIIIPPQTTPAPPLNGGGPSPSQAVGFQYNPDGSTSPTSASNPPKTYTYWTGPGGTTPVTVPMGTPMPVGAYDSPPGVGR